MLFYIVSFHRDQVRVPECVGETQMLSAGRVPANKRRSGAFHLKSFVQGLYFKQAWVLAVVLKTLDQQFKNDGYYFPEDNWQASEYSSITSWDLAFICMVPLLLSVLWLIWDHHVFFLWW